MRFLTALTLLLALQWAGDLVQRALPRVPLSGPLWGMLLLFALLALGVLRESWVQPAAEPLVGTMGLFFVPLGVGILAYGDLVGRHWPAIVLALVAGSTLTLFVTGTLARWLHRSS